MKKTAILLSVLFALTACATKPNFAFLEKVAVDQNTDLLGQGMPAFLASI